MVDTASFVFNSEEAAKQFNKAVDFIKWHGGKCYRITNSTMAVGLKNTNVKFNLRPKLFAEEKVFGIGFGRTGTMSLADAMSILGYKSRKQRPITMNDVADYDFIGTLPNLESIKIFNSLTINAKFIMTVREMESWIESCKKTLGARVSEKAKNLVVGLYKEEDYWQYWSHVQWDEELYRQAMVKYTELVRKYFKEEPEKLLILDISKGEGWEKLCPFLGKEIPEESFPWRHQGVLGVDAVNGDDELAGE